MSSSAFGHFASAATVICWGYFNNSKGFETVTKLERVTGITLLTGLICTLQIRFLNQVFERVSIVIGEIAKSF